MMKKISCILAFALILGLFIGPVTATAQMMGQGMRGYYGGSGSNYGPNYCPYCGRHLGEPGEYERMRPYMGFPGMMGPGTMREGYQPYYKMPAKLLEEKDAREMVENFLQFRRNPNLKVGNVKDEGNFFEVEILTRDDSLVDKFYVDKNTGMIRSIY